MGAGRSVLSALNKAERTVGAGILAACPRCKGGGKVQLPATGDWKTYVVKNCPSCKGGGRTRRNWIS